MSNNLTLICNTEELSDPGSYGFEVETDAELVEGFVVKNDGQYFAYRNACPHTGATLEWIEHQFLDMDGTWIQCSVHDARFVIESGECVMGPCSGESLEKLEIELKDLQIYLKTP